MISIICDCEWSEAIVKRKEFKAIDPYYIPNQTPLHLRSAEKFFNRKTFLRERLKAHIKNCKNYLQVPTKLEQQDSRLGVARLNEKEREVKRIIISQGKLWQFHQDKPDGPLTLSLFDTRNHIASSKYRGRAIYVLSPRGELFASSSEIGKFHHSSLLNGGWVICGGMLEVIDGQLMYIDEFSGHYSPKLNNFLCLLRELKTRKVINEETIIQSKLCQREKRGSSLQTTIP